MSHFPCLEKDYIQGVLNPYESHLPQNWRGYLNSEILDKYLQIKRNQKQKIHQILPRYHIFPKNFNTYNIYTNQYDLDRLQRLKNSSNAKYVNNKKSKPKKSHSQQPQDLMFTKSASQVFIGQNSTNRPGWEEENNSGLRFVDSKSTKSLTETQISPSKISKNHNHRNPSKQIIESDSELSAERHNFFMESRENRKEADNKSWTSNSRSHKNLNGHKGDQQMFSNVESAITVMKREKNGGRRNQDYEDYYYEQEMAYNGRSMKPGTGNERDNSTRRNERSPKNLLYFHSRDQYEIGKNNHNGRKGRENVQSRQNQQNHGHSEVSNFEIGRKGQKQQFSEQRKPKEANWKNQSQNQNDQKPFFQSPFNPRYQQSQIEKNNKADYIRKETDSRISSRQRVLGVEGKSKAINHEAISNKKMGEGSHSHNHNHKNNHQSHNREMRKERMPVQNQNQFSHSNNSNTMNLDENCQDSPKPSISSQSRSSKHSNHSSHSNQILYNQRSEENLYDCRNTLSKNQTVDNETQISNIEDKLLEYYGDEFQRVKAERDYLRKNFIEHLEKHHTEKLPYKHLTEIKVDETGKKLIISQRAVPFSKQEKDNQVFHAQIVEYTEKKKKK